MESQSSKKEEEVEIVEDSFTMDQLKEEFERVVNNSFYLINGSSKNVLQRVFKKIVSIPFDEGVTLGSSKEEKTLFEHVLMAMYLKDKMVEKSKSNKKEEGSEQV